jgi:xanthine dehydrogenase accessory factor
LAFEALLSQNKSQQKSSGPDAVLYASSCRRMSEHSTASQAIGDAIREVLSTGASAVLITVVEVPRSASLRVGSKLLLRETGASAGTLGSKALDEAVANAGDAFVLSRDEARTLPVEQIAPALQELKGASLLFERIESEPRLVIAGAGHVGASLARLAALVGYRVTLIDDRSEFVRRKLFISDREQAIELVAADDWMQALGQAIDSGRGVSVAIVTRGHKQDEDCLRAAIAARPDYIGMIGSKRRTNIVLEKLREEGADESELQKVRAPIGLDIGAVSPEEVALAILAEIVAERRGGSGAPLSSWRRG